MSASLYASVGRTARQLINKFGKRMIYRQKKDGQVYNDQTMRYEPSIKDTPFKGIRKNAKIEENPELPVQLGDCIILAAASGLPVTAVPDQIIMDGETWSVVDSAPVAPGDTALVHNILIRRGSRGHCRHRKPPPSHQAPHGRTRPSEHVRRPRTRQGHDGDVRPVCGIRPEYRRAGGL